MAFLTRNGISDEIRRLLRQYNTKPITDDHIWDGIEDAIDDICVKAPFYKVTDLVNSEKNASECDLPLDILEIVEVFYMDAAGATLKTPLDATTTPEALEVNEDISDFPDTGTLLVGTEQITYTGKDAKTFTGLTRGANSTTKAAHSALVKVTEYGYKYVRLEPSTTRNMGDDDESYISADPAVPETYTVDVGDSGYVLAFNAPVSKSGVENIMVRSYARPPYLTRDPDKDEDIVGVPLLLRKAIKYKAASIVAVVLAQDEASERQGKIWHSDYMSEVAGFLNRKHLMLRGLESQVVPITGRT